MKIAFLLTQLEIGGAQTRVLQTAAELRRRGHHVDVVFLYKKRECFDEEQKIILSNRTGVRAILEAAPRLWRLLKKAKYEAVITNTAPANIIGNAVAAAVGIDRRLACQTQPPQRLNAIYRVLDLLAGSAGIYRYNIANSHWTYQCFADYPRGYRQRLHVILNGISPRTIDVSRAEARARLGLAEDEIYLLTIGRLSRQKGQDTLIRAMTDVSMGNLLIVGAGELRDELEALTERLGLSNRVRFIGEVSGSDVALYLKACNVFAFPSRWETFGLAVVEAAASGLPIVASDLDVLREVLTDAGGELATVLVPVDDIASLAAAINEIIAEPMLAAAYSEKSLQIANLHSLDRHVDNLLRAIASIEK